MFGPQEFKSRLLAIDEFIGCTDEEIHEIELSAGFMLPKSYMEFMRIAGKNSGRFLRDCEIHYPQVIHTNQRTKEAAGKFIDLPNPCFFFFNYIGVSELFFTDESDNPPIYKLVVVNGTDTYKQCSPSFWNGIEELLKEYESR